MFIQVKDRLLNANQIAYVEWGIINQTQKVLFVYFTAAQEGHSELHHLFIKEEDGQLLWNELKQITKM